jgi:predicted RNA-binding protein YlxR (DUF448 family)
VKRTGPERTCLGCRQVRPQAELIRLTRGVDGRARVEAGGKGTGRGAYACPTVECLTGALRKGRLDHAFRRPTQPPVERIMDMLERWNSTGKGDELWRDV